MIIFMMFVEVLINKKSLIMKLTVNKQLKTLKVILLVTLFSVSGLQAQNVASAKKTATIDFESEILDYGTIEKGTDGTRTFIFTNSGNAPLIISDVKTSCGCTVPTYSKEAILPGEEGEIKVKYDTKKVGAFTKTITVSSNANLTRKTLKIKGTIVAVN